MKVKELTLDLPIDALCCPVYRAGWAWLLLLPVTILNDSGFSTA